MEIRQIIREPRQYLFDRSIHTRQLGENLLFIHVYTVYMYTGGRVPEEYNIVFYPLKYTLFLSSRVGCYIIQNSNIYIRIYGV